MTDFEMTKLCAEAMEMDHSLESYSGRVYVQLGLRHSGDGPSGDLYDPLHDDAQAMALVKKMSLCISSSSDPSKTFWGVGAPVQSNREWSHDLNRAIVEFVAKMQAATAEKK